MTCGHHQLRFVPAVSAELRSAVESLFFFNPRQDFVRDGIRRSVEEHGIPEIFEVDGQVWLGVRSGTMQCLFACDDSNETSVLAGVVLYARPRPEVISITHLAVDPEYAANGAHGLGLILVDKVRQVARRMKGVTQLQLPYKPGWYLPVA
jgi:hypothetical protein